MAVGALIPAVRWTAYDADGTPSPGAKLYTYLSGLSTPQAVYSDSALTTPRTNPVVADAVGQFPTFYTAAVAYRIFMTDANGTTLIPNTDNVYDFAQVQLATAGSSTGAALVGFLNSGSGVIATTVQAKLREWLSLKNDFGAVGDNSTDDSAAVEAWLAACHATGRKGHAEAGRYRLTRQVAVTLTNDNPLYIFGDSPGSNVSPYGTHFVLGTALASNDVPAIYINGATQTAWVTVDSIRVSASSVLTGSGMQIKNVSGRVVVRNSRFVGFAGRGLWIYSAVGMLLDAVFCDQNGRGLDVDGVTSHAEGCIIASKFASNTTSQIDINAGTTYLHIAGTTVYGGNSLPVAPGVRFLGAAIVGLGFYQCNFESSSPAMVAGSGIGVNDLTVEGCTFNPTFTSGTGYAIDLDSVAGARIQHNSFDCNPSLGATIIGVRIANAASRQLEIGPNTFVNGGAGTLTPYSLPTSTALVYGIDPAGAVFSAVKVNQTAKAMQVKGPTFELANAAIQSLTDAPEGWAMVNLDEDNDAAMVYFRGISGSVTIPPAMDPSSRFSTTAGNATTCNIYWDAGDARYEIQNLRGAARTISIVLIGSGF